MSQLISCPQCGRKLSVRSEHTGKRLKCPHCKEGFSAPAAEAPDIAESADAPAAGFLDELSSVSAGRPQPARPAARATQKRKQQGIPKELIIGGAIAGVLLLFGLILFAVTQSSSRSGASKAGTVKFGLAEKERRQIFVKLLGAIDLYGWQDPQRVTQWKGICSDHKIAMDVAEKVIDEGFSEKWEQPLPKINSDTGRSHRMDYIKWRTQSGK